MFPSHDLEGGSVSSSLTPEDIIALYGAVQSPPVTLEEIQTQAAQMSGLFPEPRKQNIYDYHDREIYLLALVFVLC